MTQELLNMEQLGGVAGGTKLETTEDCEFLNSLNGSIRRYSITDIGIHDYDDKVRSAWAKLGVSVIVDSGNFFSNGDANKYYVNGKQVSQEAARQHAMQVFGKQMTREDWNW